MDQPVKISLEELSFYYGDFQALKDVTLKIRAREIFGLMGPAKSGKTTLLRVLNRMCDLINGVRLEGRVWLDGEDILTLDNDVVSLRRRIGLVLSQPTPLPRSTFENLVWLPACSEKPARNWQNWWRKASRPRNCGTKSRTGCMNQH